MGDMGEDFKALREYRASQRQQSLEQAEALDDGGWEKHTDYHWSRMLNGHKLDYWPTKNKYRYQERTMHGDVNKLIRDIQGGDDSVNLNCRDVYRATDVKRWGIVKVHRTQSVAEHSYQVAMLALAICERMGCGEPVTGDVLRLALTHDLPEVLTGDLATPLKSILGDEARDRLRDLEDKVYVGGYPATASDERVKSIVKAADMVEAVAFLNLNAASPHAEAILKRISWKVATMPHEVGQAAREVMEEVTSASETTLDDLIGDQPWP